MFTLNVFFHINLLNCWTRLMYSINGAGARNEHLLLFFIIKRVGNVASSQERGNRKVRQRTSSPRRPRSMSSGGAGGAVRGAGGEGRLRRAASGAGGSGSGSLSLAARPGHHVAHYHTSDGPSPMALAQLASHPLTFINVVSASDIKPFKDHRYTCLSILM